MMMDASLQSDVISIRRPSTMSLAAALELPIIAWLHRVLPGQQILAAARLGGGYTNENTVITTLSGRYVLRRYRRGAGTEAARTVCAIEAALIERLRTTAVPVPEVVAAEPAGTEAGEPLLLTRHVAGVLVSEAIDHDGGSAAAQIGHAAGRALAAIGAVRFERGGCFTGPDLVPAETGTPGGLQEFVENCLQAGQAPMVMAPRELAGLRALAADLAPLAASTAAACQLVHSDYNGKNLLAVRRDGRWSISAVLDWEFAFSGSPLADIGNMLRFSSRYPRGFPGGFIAGYQQAGGELPAHWRELSEALDLYALADFLTRPPEQPYFGKAVSLIRERLARDGWG
jgi:aminoglycoside phosphotransferase (APT) family kinase protein